MRFANSTELDSSRLEGLLVRHTWPYRHDKLTVAVRYSRGADFSGKFYYRDNRIFINLGRTNRYPYFLATHVARAKSNKTHWWREFYMLELANAEQLVLFIYLHELFHYLVKAGKRCTRRKEAMCDRFATRVLVDHFACPLRSKSGALVTREAWDFQDLDRFVASAPRQIDSAPMRRARRRASRVPAPVELVHVASLPAVVHVPAAQLMFDFWGV